MNEKALTLLEYDKIISRLSRHASSDPGRDLCLNLKPLKTCEEAKLAQKMTADAVLRLKKRPSPKLAGLKDITPSLRRLDKEASLTAKELLDISSVLDCAASSVIFLKSESEGALADSLYPLLLGLHLEEDLNKEIKRCILGYNEIADDASPKLREIRKTVVSVNQQISRTLNRMVNSATLKTYMQDALVTMRNGRYCIPVKVEHRNQVPGMIHDQSASGSTLFIEPAAIVKLNNDLKELALAEEEEIQHILMNLSSMAREVKESLEYDFNILKELDFILAKARYSEEIKGVEPAFNNDRYMELKSARHPLLSPDAAVPISFSLGRDHSMLIITGPNTGGKTVSLKTAGLLTLMGCSGLNIPAAEGSSIYFFDEIYADIGDEQSIEQSLSTFSAHMSNLVQIIEKADSSSFILLDELCSGTDPLEGAALAQAILTFLHKMDIRCMATTHYSELKIFAMDTTGVENACCEFDVETLRPTFRLFTGLPGKSNAFEISGKLGLSKHIIDDAEALIDSESASFEDLLADIEKNRRSSERSLKEAEELKEEAASLKKALDTEKEKLTKKKDSILREANEEALLILQDAKDFADSTIRAIRKSSKSGGADISSLERIRQGAGEKIKESSERLALKKESVKNKVSASGEILPGSAVKVLSLGLTGRVKDISQSKKSADKDPLIDVQLGSMNMRVKLSDLELIEETFLSELQKGKTSSNLAFSKALGISHEIKLLGMSADEAIIELDKYLDDACMAHLDSVRIVHGKGTGILRNAVSEYLRKQKRVKSFSLAEYGEGDSGVTIAKLR